MNITKDPTWYPPIEYSGIRTPLGNVIHLYDVEGDCTATLCGRRIGKNPRQLAGPSNVWALPPEQVGCRTCYKMTLTDNEASGGAS